MTTVKEFKDLGVTYIGSDVMMGQALSDDGAEYLMASKSWDDDETTSLFAWRPINTLPDNPKFKYEFNYASLSSKPKDWRPLLDQSALKPVNGVALKPSDDKPVFTQEMAEPSIGFKLKFNHDIDGKFSRLHDEKYGWEDGDKLEVIHITEDRNDETYQGD